MKPDIAAEFKKFVPLYAALGDVPDLRPLLAHYTSTSVVEKILTTEEVWASNPLFMNDLEEMRFGLNTGYHLFMQSTAAVAEAAGTNERAQRLRETFEHYYRHYDAEHALKVYVFCLSEHNEGNDDGVLSMWRGYGKQGNGAAIVFDARNVTMMENSPLAFTKVRYATRPERESWLRERISDWCRILRDGQIADDRLYVPAYALFQLIVLYALSSKHKGFEEEREWRIIYQPDRDPQGKLLDWQSYIIGENGVEPKFKLKIAPMEGVLHDSVQFDRLVHRIILGPTVSSPLARNAFVTMLKLMGKEHFADRVAASTIPLRPI